MDKNTTKAPQNDNNSNNNNSNNNNYSLNDDRRVKVLSPGRLVAKRFFRNKIAVVGIWMLVAMFLFSFVGGLISPYSEDQQFYTYENQDKEFAGVTENVEFRYTSAPDQDFNSIIQAQFVLAYNQKKDSFEYKDVTYDLEAVSDDLYIISSNGTELAYAAKDIVNSEGGDLSYYLKRDSLKAYNKSEDSFSVDGNSYKIDDDGNIYSGQEVVGYISRFVMQAVSSDIVLTRDFKEAVQDEIESGNDSFSYTDENGETQEYKLSYNPNNKVWSVIQSKATYVYDSYAEPSLEHPLGTDTNGMDMITRLMYGGRVSLIIGFIVVIIEGVFGIILGGISGYFGGWVDQLIMRIVDVFYCIPSLPLIIILGAAMDAMRIEPFTRLIYLMLILGFLGWPSIARLVRGQILSLREQEFMAAAEAGGISSTRRIFRHLIPNVIPQLIVICTMSLGSTIITEATLSFLGLGVKFPFASWGNIINDVNNAFVMTHYWFIWIPAGICLLITVLGFNFVGDGLRDAFDPRMNR